MFALSLWNPTTLSYHFAWPPPPLNANVTCESSLKNALLESPSLKRPQLILFSVYVSNSLYVPMYLHAENIIGLHLTIIWYLNDLNYYHNIGRSSPIFNYSFFYLFPQHLRLAAWPQVIALIMESNSMQTRIWMKPKPFGFFQCTVIRCVLKFVFLLTFRPITTKCGSQNYQAVSIVCSVMYYNSLTKSTITSKKKKCIWVMETKLKGE